MKSRLFVAIGAVLVLAAVVIFSFSTGTTQQSARGRRREAGQYLVTIAAVMIAYTQDHDQSGRRIRFIEGAERSSGDRQITAATIRNNRPPAPINGGYNQPAHDCLVRPLGSQFRCNLTPDMATAPVLGQKLLS